jgi:hypothetical protein
LTNIFIVFVDNLCLCFPFFVLSFPFFFIFSIFSIFSKGTGTGSAHHYRSSVDTDFAFPSLTMDNEQRGVATAGCPRNQVCQNVGNPGKGFLSWDSFGPAM